MAENTVQIVVTGDALLGIIEAMAEGIDIKFDGVTAEELKRALDDFAPAEQAAAA